MAHPLITTDPDAQRIVTLADCNSLTLYLESEGPSCCMVPKVRVWRSRPQRIVWPDEPGKRITDLRPGDFVRHHGIHRRVERMVLHDS